jgi:hypothetical protein
MKIHPKPDNICSYFETARFFPGQVDASLRKPHQGAILQSASGEELRPLYGRTLISCPKGTSSPSLASGMPSILDKAFKGEL